MIRRSLLGGLLALLVGCDPSARIEAEIAETKAEVEELDRIAKGLRQALKRARSVVDLQATAAMPEGYDPDRPLPSGDPRRPDVIVLSVDTLRADHLGAWGYARDTSPFLDRLAAEGTRFESAWSPSPWTLPAHTTMLTGRLPRDHGAVEDHVQIPSDIPMLQEAFGHAGYATGAAVATLFVSSRYGFDRGFDFFHDFEITGAKVNAADTVDAEHVFGWALDWAQGLPDGQPVFLFLHVYDAHYTYNAPEPWNTRFDRAPRLGDAAYVDYQHHREHPLSDAQMTHQVAQYDEEIAYVDDAFRALIEKWAAERPNLVVTVTADHGEEFGERGSWGHAHTLYPEQLHVPWIVWGGEARAQVVHERVGLEDLATTLASLASLPFPSDGVDRAEQVRTGRPPDVDQVPARFAETSRFQTLRHRWHAPPWDLYVDLEEDRVTLCNLDADPGCAEDRAPTSPERVGALSAEMSAWLGQDWEARDAGVVTVADGRIYQAGARVRGRSLEVEPGATFAVFPADAWVTFSPKGGGADQGPWRITGGAAPGGGAGLVFLGRRSSAGQVELSDQERELLEALGYLQE